MTNAEDCLRCAPDSNFKKKVCSIDGNAWCCDVSSTHPLCNCQGELMDFVYCPSSTGCGPSLFNFTGESPDESIAANITSPELALCVFEIASDENRFIQLRSNSYMTVLDPQQTRQTCMTSNCNVTLRVTPGNDYYAFFVGAPLDLEFIAVIDHSGEK